MEWRIWADSSPVDPDRCFDLAGDLQQALEGEPAALGPVAGAELPKLNAVFLVEAGSLLEASQIGNNIFASALKAATNGQAVPLAITAEPEGYEDQRQPSLLGASDVAKVLKVTRQRVYQLLVSPGFPSAVVELDRGKLWSRADIETWMATRRRGNGRPPGKLPPDH
ncbi:MAG TPA: helix-turn-helix domain-containing protein [Actinomycetota bacterium]|nr:helix-turn-helix domain-containing protein [Actinomycetota bacterium]